MTTAHHLNAGVLHAPPNPKASCHCLLLEDPAGHVLIDTGIGLEDVRRPVERIGQPVIDAAGFQFDENNTAFRKIERLGLRPADVRHIVLTHADPDHTGGLSDFPDATVHLAAEELANVERGHWRYSPRQFAHGVRWRPVASSSADHTWFGLPARPLDLGLPSDVLLIPLFGHTLGHCGVAVRRDARWLLHVGDAYYLRGELTTDDHPVSKLAAMRADDDASRIENLQHLRRLLREHRDEVDLFGYHDFTEFPAENSAAHGSLS